VRDGDAVPPAGNPLHPERIKQHMKANELKALLRRTIPAGLPILIKGAPGIGKSDIVAQAAGRVGADLVVSHPVVSDPTDYKGLPAIVGGQAEFLPFGGLRALMGACVPTVAFLDDLGQAPAVVQAAAMQLILGRRINGHAISSMVTFVAATNRREDRAGVTGILEPVKSRFATIVELNVDVDAWCQWAAENDVPVEVIAFIRFRPELLMDTSRPTNDIVNRPSPRTVTYAGKLFSLGLEDPESFGGACGEGWAAEFLGFVRMWRQLPSIDGILVNPGSAEVPSDPAALFAVSTALAERACAKSGSRIMQYLARLPEEFAVLCIRDAIRRDPGFARCKRFISWAAENSEMLS